MKKINLENFRCFNSFDLSFKPGINLLIGDNASGKTSIFRACRHVLSAFFSGFSDDNTKWYGIDNSDFMIIRNDGVLLPDKPIKIGFDFDGFNHIVSVDDNIMPFTIEKKSRKNSRALVSGFSEYRRYAKHLYDNMYDSDNNRLAQLPVFVAFSTEDIHTKRQINHEKFKSYAQKATFGYYECLSGGGCFNYWVERLIVLDEGENKLPVDSDLMKSVAQEKRLVISALLNSLGHNGCDIINDIAVHSKQGKVYFTLKDGRVVDAFNLSDGYQRLVNIILDIAFRCVILNRELFGDDTCAKSYGTVLIDEIDLHLHPTLQSIVLNGLIHTFPNLQFIVTTHAPMIMSNVMSNDRNVVYKLDFSNNQYSATEVETYGMDLSTVVSLFGI